MYKILASCFRGLETYLAEELSWHGFEAVQVSSGSVIVEIQSPDQLSYLHQNIRICEDLDLLLLESENICSF